MIKYWPVILVWRPKWVNIVIGVLFVLESLVLRMTSIQLRILLNFHHLVLHYAIHWCCKSVEVLILPFATQFPLGIAFNQSVQLCAVVGTALLIAIQLFICVQANWEYHCLQFRFLKGFLSQTLVFLMSCYSLFSQLLGWLYFIDVTVFLITFAITFEGCIVVLYLYLLVPHTVAILIYYLFIILIKS
jgi:hypothetical protein